MGYGLTRNKLICLDAGHFHPTEVISNKLSSLSLFGEGMLLHVSRPVRGIVTTLSLWMMNCKKLPRS